MQNVAIQMLTEELLTDYLYAVFYYNYPGFIRQDNRLLLQFTKLSSYSSY